MERKLVKTGDRRFSTSGTEGKRSAEEIKRKRKEHILGQVVSGFIGWGKPESEQAARSQGGEK